MKIRIGFVSNSSSSSFIVGFDKKPETVEELQKTMFGDSEYLDGDYLGKYNTKEVAEVVFNEFKVNSPDEFGEVYGAVTRVIAEKELDEYYTLSPWSVCINPGGKCLHGFSEEEISEVFDIGYETSPEYIEWRKIWDEIDSLTDDMFDERNKKWKYEWELKDRANLIVNNLIKEIRSDILDAPLILLVEYSDNDGPFDTFLEHANIFKKLPHIRISKH